MPGVRLSRGGSWGNIPHADEQAAQIAASINAAGQPFTIKREKLRALPEFSKGIGARP